MAGALAMMACPVMVVVGQSQYTSDITQVLTVPHASRLMVQGVWCFIGGFVAFVAARFIGWFWEP